MFHAAVAIADPLPRRVFPYSMIGRIGSRCQYSAYRRGIWGRMFRAKWLFCCPWYHQSVVGILESFLIQLAELEQFTEAVYSLRGGGAHQRALRLATKSPEDQLVAVEQGCRTDARFANKLLQMYVFDVAREMQSQVGCDGRVKRLITKRQRLCCVLASRDLSVIQGT